MICPNFKSKFVAMPALSTFNNLLMMDFIRAKQLSYINFARRKARYKQWAERRGLLGDPNNCDDVVLDCLQQLSIICSRLSHLNNKSCLGGPAQMLLTCESQSLLMTDLAECLVMMVATADAFEEHPHRNRRHPLNIMISNSVLKDVIERHVLDPYPPLASALWEVTSRLLRHAVLDGLPLAAQHWLLQAMLHALHCRPAATSLALYSELRALHLRSSVTLSPLLDAIFNTSLSPGEDSSNTGSLLLRRVICKAGGRGADATSLRPLLLLVYKLLQVVPSRPVGGAGQHEGEVTEELLDAAALTAVVDFVSEELQECLTGRLLERKQGAPVPRREGAAEWCRCGVWLLEASWVLCAATHRCPSACSVALTPSTSYSAKSSPPQAGVAVLVGVVHHLMQGGEMGARTIGGKLVSLQRPPTPSETGTVVALLGVLSNCFALASARACSAAGDALLYALHSLLSSSSPIVRRAALQCAVNVVRTPHRHQWEGGEASVCPLLCSRRRAYLVSVLGPALLTAGMQFCPA